METGKLISIRLDLCPKELLKCEVSITLRFFSRVRFLLAFVAQSNLELERVDSRTVFPNGYLSEETYLELPKITKQL